MTINKNNCPKIITKLLFGLLLLLSACDGYSCIDADDFGEYEIQTFRVNANRLSEYCEYKEGQSTTSQPLGIKECLSDVAMCPSINELCIERCESQCYSSSETIFNTVLNRQSITNPQGAIGFSDPPWVSIGGGGNNQLSIEENSQISITAQGTIDLGGESPDQVLSYNPQNQYGSLELNSIAKNTHTNLAKFIGGENLDLNFYGKFQESISSPNFFNISTIPSSAIDNNFNYNNDLVANGARRILAYMIPFPEGYFDFKNYNFPLDPEPKTWPCKVDASKLICSDDSACSSDPANCDNYNLAMTAGISDSATESKFNSKFSEVFNVNNETKDKAFHKNKDGTIYGTGFIRSNDDGLIGADVNPTISSYIVNIPIIDMTGFGYRLNFPNPTKDYAIVFVYKKTDPASATDCLTNDIEYQIADSNGSFTKSYDAVFNLINDNGTFTSTPALNNIKVINKKDLARVTIKRKSTSATTYPNCTLKAYLYEFHEIKFAQSGYIQFGIVDGAMGPTASLNNSRFSAKDCQLKFKIYHEQNDDEDEFANFNYPLDTSNASYQNVGHKETSSHYVVTIPGSYAMCSSNLSCDNNPKKYFIRKGQKLSFHPFSWNGTWIPNPSGSSPLTTNCGVGFYVKFTPRPAVFCPDFKINEYLSNDQDQDLSNDCSPKTESDGRKIFCEPDYSSCEKTTISGPTPSENPNFCPYECIPRDFSACKPRDLTTIKEDFTITNDYLFSLNNASLNSFAPIANCAIDPIYYCYSSGSQGDNTVFKNKDCSGTNASKCKSYSQLVAQEPYKSMIDSNSILLVAATDERNGDYNKMNQNRCMQCEGYLTTKSKTTFKNSLKSSVDLQQCYNVEDYTGTIRALEDHIKKINSLSSAAYKAKAGYLLLNHKTVGNYDAPDLLSMSEGGKNFLNKGLKKLESFGSNDGNFGNLYPVKYKAGSSSPHIFSLGKNISISSPSFLKFIILDDVPIDASPNIVGDYFEANTPPVSFTSNTFTIKINSKNSYSNGDKLSVAICKESSSSTSICANFNDYDTESQTLNISPLNVVKYNINDDLDNSSNYKFNEYGQLVRLNPASHLIDCSIDGMRPYVGANFLCFNDGGNTDNNNPSLNNRYRIAFKIFDNQTLGNCKSISTPDTFIECDQGSSGCNKFKSINQNWDGTLSGFCNSSDNPCTKKFICNDSQYFNNIGHYDVAVKIKRGSKVKVSNFINSIISPILQEIDGVNIIENKEFQIGGNTYNNVYNFINSINPYYNVAFYHGYLDSSTDIYIGPLSNATINSLKAIDNKIIGDEFVTTQTAIDISSNPASKTSVYLNPNATNVNCKNKCFISHIVYASFSTLSSSSNTTIQASCPLRSHRVETMERIRRQCQGKSSCQIIVDPTIEVSKLQTIATGSESAANEAQINNEKTDPICKYKNFSVLYLYSFSDQTFYKENQIQRLYNLILVNPIYKSFLTLSVVLMFSFYGMGFLMGVSELKQSEIVDRLIKIGIIYLFTNPSFGWVWFDKFFVTFFKNSVDFLTYLMASFFDETGQIESALLNNDFSNKSLLFGGTDRIIDLFVNNDIIHKKIMALVFYKFFGILYTMIIYYSAITYVYTISNAVLLYLTAQFFTSILFSVGPFFFVFILFKQTKTFFDNWINSLIGFALQQIFLVFTLSLFNSFLYSIIKLTLGYRICWDSVWEINLTFSKISLLSFWTPQESPSYISETMDPIVSGSPSGIPTLPKLLSLWSVCVIMKSFISQIADLAATLSGGMSVSDLSSGISSAMNKGIGDIKQKISKAYSKTGIKAMERLDQKMFDSGTLAKQARKKAAANDEQNRKLKSKMLSDGDKAVKDYKINNSAKFSKMSEAEKRAKLSEVKTKAMINSAKQAGKGDEAIKKLMSDKKGSSYQGDNVFGLAKSMAMNRIRNQRTSLDEKAISVNTGMSKNEMKETLKKLDGPEKRQEFLDSVKSGDIQKRDGGIINKLSGSVGGAISRLDPTGGAATAMIDPAKGAKDERKIAIQQLEKSGEIAKQSYENKDFNSIRNIGSNIAGNAKSSLAKRSDEDERKIVARMEKNRNEQAINKGSNTSARDIDKLDSFSKYLDKKENNASYEEKMKDKDTREPNKENEKAIENTQKESSETKLNEQNSKISQEKPVAIENFEKSLKTLNEAEKNISGNETHKRMDELRDKMKSGADLNKNEKVELNELKEKDRNMPEGQRFEDKINARSEARASHGENQATLENINKKEEKLNQGEKIDTVSEAIPPR